MCAGGERCRGCDARMLHVPRAAPVLVCGSMRVAVSMARLTVFDTAHDGTTHSMARFVFTMAPRVSLSTHRMTLHTHRARGSDVLLLGPCLHHFVEPLSYYDVVGVMEGFSFNSDRLQSAQACPFSCTALYNYSMY